MCKAHARRSRGEGSINSWVGRCWDILTQIWMEEIWEKKLVSKRILGRKKKKEKENKGGGCRLRLWKWGYSVKYSITLSSICLRAQVLMYTEPYPETASVQHFHLYPKSNFLANLEKMTTEKVIRVPFVWVPQVWHSRVKRLVKLLSIDLHSPSREKQHTLILVYETCVSLQYFPRIYYFS